MEQNIKPEDWTTEQVGDHEQRKTKEQNIPEVRKSSLLKQGLDITGSS